MILLLIPLVIFLAAIVQGTIGFGYAIVSLALFSYFLDFREANVIIAVSVLAPLVSAVWTYRGELKIRTLVICLVGAIVGLPVGLYFFSVVNETLLIQATGALIFLLSAEGLWSMRKEIKIETERETFWLWSSVAGVASGFLTGAIGMGGPPVAAFATRQPWSPRQIKVFLLAFSFLTAVLRVGGLATAGWLDLSVLGYCLLAIPFALIGIYVGLKVSHNIDARAFRALTMGTLLLLSLGMIFR
ncbi:sulfite exporter TauE/SafE family protein [Blastopirellula sp. JC732]|uniref:Probable membrane transporter protein n=1 Tax=Blastopirellula sediminis TaxID=2894196 RepID=A0A9X1MPP2_9BACT|nr:sulfite exporter TauE/SafE family protein [Blastopirellula sediminis]MCC9630534.1 sulfite exporter TauE/SafE family protein [Blastopirellula sediminis]